MKNARQAVPRVAPADASGDRFKQTEIGEIPSDWDMVSLGDLCKSPSGFIQTGPFGSQLHASEYAGEGVPIVNPTHLDGNKIRRDEIPLVGEADAQRLERHELRVGDILFSRRGDVGRHAHVSEEEDGWLCGTGCLLVRPTSNMVDALFLNHFMSTAPVQEYLTSHAVGSIMPNINTKILSAAPVALPPLPEQRAIAAVLSKIQSAVEVQDKIVATLKELKAATMAKLFREGLRGEPLKQTEIGEIPESWEVVRLNSICERMNYGTSVHCTAEREGRPVLRIPNVIDERIATSDLKYACLPEAEAERLALQTGDMLFVRTNGNRQYTGRCAVYIGEPAGAAFASYLIRVRLAKDAVLPEFAQAYLSSVGREQITSRANPAADGKYNIDTGILKSILLPRPPSREQRQIMTILDTISIAGAAAQGRARTSKQLFSSMLHLLMTGQVRVNGIA